MELHASGQSLNQLTKQFKLGKATVFDIVKAAKASAPGERPLINAGRKQPPPMPAKVSKRPTKAVEKPTTAIKHDARDMELRTTLERKGQRRLDLATDQP